MTEPERRALRHALDRHRRAAICGDLAAEPTLVGCCDHCGRRYTVPSRKHSLRFCSAAHRTNWYLRRERFARMAAVA